MKNKLWVIIGIIISTITFSCKKEIQPASDSESLNNQHNNGQGSRHDNLPNDVILQWSEAAFNAAGGAAEIHPLLSVRIEAMMHIAMHDAINSTQSFYQPYVYLQDNPSANAIAAAASAAHTVLSGSYGSSPAFDAQLASSLSGIPNGTAKTQGIATGIAAGNAILAMRAGDGAFQNPIDPLIPPSTPGVYATVPPFTFVYATFWKDMQTFSLQNSSQFRSPPPPSLTSMNYTKDFNEVKLTGRLTNALRTSDQTAYANWWYELSDIGWNRIARLVSSDEHTGLYATARLFALLNMAMHDAYTAGWDSKYFYNFWRPYTAIRAGSTDGNPLTNQDNTWESLMPTPPVPDYPSTHSAVGNAAAAVLTHVFGNPTHFSMVSTTALPAGTSRSFNSFKEAANENADSRVRAGIHFRFACDAGQKMGDKVGKWTVENYLEPIHNND